MSATRIPELVSAQPPVVPESQPARHRILSVVRFPVGGIRTHLHYTYPHLQAAGYRFTFVVPDADSYPAFAKTVAPLEDVECIRVPIRKGRCHLWPEVRRQIRTGRYSLMHSHGFTAAVQSAFANFGKGLPHLTTIHDVARDEQFRGVKGRLSRWALGWMLRQLDVIIAVGEDVRENLLQKLSPLRRYPQRIKVIPNGVDVEQFHSPMTDAEVELRARFQIPNGTALLGFLGRFMEQKGFVVLLQALRQLLDSENAPPVHLLAVGSGDREREYRKEIARLGLDETISFMPFVHNIKPVLHQLDLLVIPSLWEAMPLLPMEALASGVQVLGTDCLGLREALAGTPSCVVRAGDATALCDGLRISLSHPWPEEAHDYAPLACERFDTRPKAQALLELFEQHVASGVA